MSTAASGQLQTQLDKLLKVARDHNAAEIRISSGGKPMLRIKGKFTPVGKRPLSKEQVEGMAAAIMGGNNDATSFLYESPLGVYECGLHDVQGTTMLALKESDKPAVEPAASQQDDMPLELDIQDEEQEETPAASPKNAGSGETFAMPKAAEGTILIDKLLTIHPPESTNLGFSGLVLDVTCRLDSAVPWQGTQDPGPTYECNVT